MPEIVRAFRQTRAGGRPHVLPAFREHRTFGILADRDQYSLPRRAVHWPNLVSEEQPRRVPKRTPSFVDVPRVLAEISPPWGPLFATAVYSRLRTGEIRRRR